MSRTGTTQHRNWRARLIHQAKATGQNACPLCHVTLNYQQGRTPNSAEADHIIPIADGGTNDLSNGRIICRRCNQQLGAKTKAKRSSRKPRPKHAITLYTSHRW